MSDSKFIKWNQQTTLSDWVVSEGLAESFAAELYGKELIGPWVTSTSPEQLDEIKSIISSQLQLTGMAEMAPYLYGDETRRYRVKFRLVCPMLRAMLMVII